MDNHADLVRVRLLATGLDYVDLHGQFSLETEHKWLQLHKISLNSTLI